MYEKDIRNGIHYNNKADQSRHIDTGSIPAFLHPVEEGLEMDNCNWLLDFERILIYGFLIVLAGSSSSVLVSIFIIFYMLEEI